MNDFPSVLADPVLGSIHAAMTSAEGETPVYERSLAVMGTTARITTVGGPADLPERIASLLEKLNGLWSRFRDDSELSHLNNSPGQAKSVSPETLRMLSEMAWGYSHTKGAYDPTVLPALLAEGYTSSLVTPGLKTHIPATSRPKGNLSAIEIREKVLLPIWLWSWRWQRGHLAHSSKWEATSASRDYLPAQTCGDSLLKTLMTAPRGSRLWSCGIKDSPHQLSQRGDSRWRGAKPTTSSIPRHCAVPTRTLSKPASSLLPPRRRKCGPRLPSFTDHNGFWPSPASTGFMLVAFSRVANG
jgi:hypothetical protein